MCIIRDKWLIYDGRPLNSEDIREFTAYRNDFYFTSTFYRPSTVRRYLLFSLRIEVYLDTKQSITDLKICLRQEGRKLLMTKISKTFPLNCETQVIFSFYCLVANYSRPWKKPGYNFKTEWYKAIEFYLFKYLAINGFALFYLLTSILRDI